jgi:hypothetical protein
MAYEDHFGGCLRFGPDGMLYFSVGDGSGYADGFQSGQDLSDFNASILRIDVDHPDHGKPTAYPRTTPSSTCTEPKARSGRTVCATSGSSASTCPRAMSGPADVGQDLWEPVVLVQKGGNYGWSVVEGTHSFRPERKPARRRSSKPVWEHEHSQARSITGGFVYHGKRFPELAGKYVYGDYDTGKVWALAWDARQQKVTEHRQLVDTPFKLVAFGQDRDGEIVLLDYQGAVYQFEPNPEFSKPDVTSHFPRKLSETGLFASTKDHVMAAGVIPYDINSPLWSDGAAKQRYMAIPGDAKIKYTDRKRLGLPRRVSARQDVLARPGEGQPGDAQADRDTPPPTSSRITGADTPISGTTSRPTRRCSKIRAAPTTRTTSAMPKPLAASASRRGISPAERNARCATRCPRTSCSVPRRSR